VDSAESRPRGVTMRPYPVGTQAKLGFRAGNPVPDDLLADQHRSP